MGIIITGTNLNPNVDSVDPLLNEPGLVTRDANNTKVVKMLEELWIQKQDEMEMRD